MLKEVEKFKDCIEKYIKYNKQPAMYVICSTKVNAHASSLSSHSYVRPCNVPFEEYVNANKTCTGLVMNLDYALCSVDFSKVDRNQFFLECTMLGIMPQVEFIDDEEGNAIDEIDLTTGISYVEMRKKVLESRKCNKS